MASAARQFDPYITPEEHERIERETGVKYEWYDGRVFAMAGAQPAHNTISVNIAGMLYNQLRGQPCEPWNSDQQVKVAARRTVLYPDITVACPPYEYDEQHRNALLNPRMIVEVSSPSTEKYDREGKFDLYKQIASLQDYVLVASDRRRIELFTRQDDGSWAQRVAHENVAHENVAHENVAHENVAHENNDCVQIASIDCRLCLDEVYERLQLPGTNEAPGNTPGRSEG